MVTDRGGHARVDYPGGAVVRPCLGHSATSGKKPSAKNFYIQSRSMSWGIIALGEAVPTGLHGLWIVGEQYATLKG